MFGLLIVTLLAAQAPAPGAERYLGAVVKVDTSTRALLMRLDSGGEKWISAPPGVEILQVTPADKDLSRATASALEDVRVGDRMLVRRAEQRGELTVATQIVLVRQTDLAEREKAEQAAWKSRGISGRVLEVDVGAGQVTLTTFSRQASQRVTVRISSTTQQRRYRAGSARFHDARAAALSDIRPGDQLLVLGERSPDGAVLNAEKLVSGSVRYYPAVVVSTNPQTQQLALRLTEGNRSAEASLAPGSVVRRLRSAGGANSTAVAENSSAVPFAELKPGDAVVIATLEDGPEQAPPRLLAIAVIAGVEALLKRSAQEQRELLGSWDLKLDVESSDGGR